MPSTGTRLQPVMEWADIMDDLVRLSPAMKSVLEGSSAFALDGVLYVDAPNSLFGQLLRRDGNAKLLGDCVRARLGRSCTIRLRKREAAQPEAAAPVDGFLDAAKQSGANINIK